MPWMEDDGTAEVAIPVTSEMWHDLHQQGVDPVEKLHDKGLDRLRMRYLVDEEEVQLIGNDPVYIESCRVEYWQTMRRFDKKRQLPKRIVLTYMRPGSRDKKMDVVEEPEPEKD